VMTVGFRCRTRVCPPCGHCVSRWSKITTPPEMQAALGGNNSLPYGFLAQVGGGEIPVHNGPEAFQILGTRVTVVDVVGMFPDVTGQQRDVGSGERRGGVAGIYDIQRTVGFLDQPGPARAEVAGSGFVEGFLEAVDAAPLRID